MDSSHLLGITTFAYLFSSLLYVFLLVFKTPRLGRVATAFTAIAFVVNTLGISWRWIESYQIGFGRAPLTNMYESLVFFAWTIIAIYLVIERKFATRAIGPFAVPMAFLAMAYASFAGNIDKAITPLVPALQSNWLIAHVVTCFIGYAAFAIAATLGMMYLVKGQRAEGSATAKGNELLPSLPLLDDLTHKTMIFGFIWLSVGIITGAIWANSAWGTYWSWDPKETWSLITWFFYAITLHARYTRGWSGKRLAILALCGFASVMFTYFGVNFLLSGLHSYGSSS